MTEKLKAKIKHFIERKFRSIKRIKRYLRKHNIVGSSSDGTISCPLATALKMKFTDLTLDVYYEFVHDPASGSCSWTLPPAATKFQHRLITGRYLEFINKCTC